MDLRKSSRNASLVVVLTLALSSALASPKNEAKFVEACGAIYRDSSGTAKGFLLPQLSKSLAVEDKFTLPPNAPRDAFAVQCGRQSIVPLLTDVKITAAGFRFTILSGERIGTLEVADGHLQFKMSRGEMTEEEMKQVGSVLDRGHAFLLGLQSRGELPAAEEATP